MAKKQRITKYDGYFFKMNLRLDDSNECLDSQSIEELADLVEVVYAILHFANVSLQEFETIRHQKVLERGAFREKLLLKQVIEG